MVLSVPLTADLSVHQRIQVEVASLPEVQLDWEESPRRTYWQHEVATLDVDVSFPAGTELEWSTWLAGLTAEAVVTDLDDEVELAKHALNVTDEDGHYQVRTPLLTESLGRKKVTVRLLKGNESIGKPLVTIVDVKPFLVFEATQRGRVVTSTLFLAEGTVEPATALRFTSHLEAGDVERLKFVEVFAQDEQGSEVLPRTRLAIEEPLEMMLDITNTPDSLSFGCLAHITHPNVNEELVLRWESRPVDIHRPPWLSSTTGRWVSGLAFSFVVLALLMAWWFKPDSPLPLMRGKLTWVTPDFAVEQISPQSSWLARLRERGRRPRKIKLGANGDVPLRFDPVDFGLGADAHLEVVLVSGETLNREGDAFLVVRGSNGGGPTPMLIEGHVQATFPGQSQAELCLDEWTAPIVLDVNAGNASLQLQIDCVAKS